MEQNVKQSKRRQQKFQSFVPSRKSDEVMIRLHIASVLMEISKEEKSSASSGNDSGASTGCGGYSMVVVMTVLMVVMVATESVQQ